MKPFVQSESAMTETAKTLNPAANQMYSGTIQQNAVREKLNAAINILNGGLKNAIL